MKVVFPILWISLFGLATLAFWRARGGNGELPPDSAKYVFLAVWVVGSTVILWLCAGLKRVRVDGNDLVVSNYLREIRIPLSDIAGVGENRWINMHPVTIRLKAKSVFGDAVTFMPKTRMLTWRPHPIVAELKQLAGLT